MFTKPQKIILTLIFFLLTMFTAVHASPSYLHANNDTINVNVHEATPIDLISNDSYSSPDTTNIDSVNGVKLNFVPNTIQVINVGPDIKVYAYFNYLGTLSMQVTSLDSISTVRVFHYTLKDYEKNTTSVGMVRVFIRSKAYKDELHFNSVVNTKTVNLLDNDKGTDLILYKFNNVSIPKGGMIMTNIKDKSGVIIATAKAYSNGVVEYTTLKTGDYNYNVNYTIRNGNYITASNVLNVVGHMY